MEENLIPVDTERCQAEIKEGSFMTFGPRKQIRCSSKPKWVAVENKAPKTGMRKGAMSLCDNCKNILIEVLGKKYATFYEIM
jgi:hypothetical protein